MSSRLLANFEIVDVTGTQHACSVHENGRFSVLHAESDAGNVSLANVTRGADHLEAMSSWSRIPLTRRAAQKAIRRAQHEVREFRVWAAPAL